MYNRAMQPNPEEGYSPQIQTMVLLAMQDGISLGKFENCVKEIEHRIRRGDESRKFVGLSENTILFNIDYYVWETCFKKSRGGCPFKAPEEPVYSNQGGLGVSQGQNYYNMGPGGGMSGQGGLGYPPGQYAYNNPRFGGGLGNQIVFGQNIHLNMNKNPCEISYQGQGTTIPTGPRAMTQQGNHGVQNQGPDASYAQMVNQFGNPSTSSWGPDRKYTRKRPANVQGGGSRARARGRGGSQGTQNSRVAPASQPQTRNTMQENMALDQQQKDKEGKARREAAARTQQSANNGLQNGPRNAVPGQVVGANTGLVRKPILGLVNGMPKFSVNTSVGRANFFAEYVTTRGAELAQKKYFKKIRLGWWNSTAKPKDPKNKLLIFAEPFEVADTGTSEVVRELFIAHLYLKAWVHTAQARWPKAPRLVDYGKECEENKLWDAWEPDAEEVRKYAIEFLDMQEKQVQDQKQALLKQAQAEKEQKEKEERKKAEKEKKKKQEKIEQIKRDPAAVSLLLVPSQTPWDEDEEGDDGPLFDSEKYQNEILVHDPVTSALTTLAEQLRRAEERGRKKMLKEQQEAAARAIKVEPETVRGMVVDMGDDEDGTTKSQQQSTK